MKSIDDPMLCRKEATEYLGLRPGTLEAWASRGSVNLPMIRLGRRFGIAKVTWTGSSKRTE